MLIEAIEQAGKAVAEDLKETVLMRLQKGPTKWWHLSGLKTDYKMIQVVQVYCNLQMERRENTQRRKYIFQNIDQNNYLIFDHLMSLIIEDAQNTFKHIHRILNTNIDGKRTVPFALDKIKGVGRRFGFLICKILRINPKLRAGELTEAQCDSIASIINDPEGHGVPRWFLNRQRDYREGKNLQMASNILQTKLREDVERLFKIRSNRGLRHKWGLKVRGQHTKTTGRRGKTVGVERKKK